MERLVRVLTIAILAWSLASVTVLAQNVKSPDENGHCEPGYFPFQEACVKISGTRDKEKMSNLMMELREYKKKRIESGKYISAIKCVVEKNKGDVFYLDKSIIVNKTGITFFGFIGYRKSCVLYNNGGGWKLAIEDKKPFDVEILKAPPSKLSSLSSYRINLSRNRNIFLINGDVYKPQTVCSGWSEGDIVVFIEGTAGVCVLAEILNLSNNEICSFQCN